VDDQALAHGLDRALGTLWMAYQPLVDANTCRPTDFEAFVRSDEPGLEEPAALFAAAELVGRVRELGREIRARLAQDLASAPQSPRIFVNLHGAEIADDALYCAGEPLRPHAQRIVFEITARASLHKIAHVIARINELRAAGFRVALDDLGSTHAGLSSFVQLKPSVVKLAASLVRHLDQSAVSRRVVGAMVSICREVNVELVGEGVETDAERRALLDLGCDLQQGFLYGRPERGLNLDRVSSDCQSPRTPEVKGT
jgi:EAL domain-containing protein (putative c-di-GMP-specific phosphodiesterase class I)